MGAGPCPVDAKAQLLRQVVDLNLGFSEAQLCRAIDYLVKEIGSLEEALALIPQDNFTLLVNYILDSDADSECQQVNSPSNCENTRKMGNQPMPNAQGGDMRCEDRKKGGGDHPTKGAIERLINGRQVGMAGGSVPLEIDHSAIKVEQQNNSLQSQRGLVDRNDLRKHFKRKLCTDTVKVPDHSKSTQVSKARVLTTQIEQNSPEKSSGHFISSEEARSAEHMVHLKRTNSVVKFEDQKTKKRRDSESVSLINESSSLQKNGEITEPKATDELIREARTLMPSGCRDLATCFESSRFEKDIIFSHKQSFLGGLTGQSQVETVAQQIGGGTSQVNGDLVEAKGGLKSMHRGDTMRGVETVAQQSGGRTSSQVKGDLVETKEIPSTSRGLKSRHRCDTMRGVETMGQQSGGRTSSEVNGDLVETKEISSTSRGLKSMHRRDTMREVETERAVLSSNNDGQKASCSFSNEISVNGKQECTPYVAGTTFLIQMEAFLKEGNCQRALEVLKTWKQKQKQVEIWDAEGTHLKEPAQCLVAAMPEGNFVQGRGHEVVADIPGKKRGFVVSFDISRGLERFPISCVNEYNTEVLPENFLYVTQSVIRQAAHVDASFVRIGDLHCCCSDDCLRSSTACKCTDSTRGEYAYDKNGRLIERLAINYQSGCTTTNGDFITECCAKCRCSMDCGNRIVQRGITRKLQVFMTPTKKGWGVRSLERIPARSFLFEYIGEIATNLEQFDRNEEYAKSGVHTYTMDLDADHDMEKSHFKEGLNDNEALVLDATIFGNVSRFVNHRCNDANLFLRPVQIETRDTHYYHAALFAARDIQEMEELTWDYGIDFQDRSHSVKAFECHCKSSSCRDKESAFSKEKSKRGKNMKSSHSKHKGVQHARE